MRGGRSLLFCLFVVAVGLAGCARKEQPAGSDVAASPVVGLGPIAVTGVQRVDATHLRVAVRLPAPRQTCARDLVASSSADERYVTVQISFTGPLRTAGRCAAEVPASIVVAVPPLNGRQLVVDYEKPWLPVPGSSAFRQCTGPFGCADPPSNHCDDAWLDLVAHSGELAPERYYKKLGCTQRWLVMDVDATVTGCQGVDGKRPAGCTSRAVRWFAEFRAPGGWVVVASGGAAGCADVHRTVPAFPDALCARLPARAG